MYSNITVASPVAIASNVLTTEKMPFISIPSQADSVTFNLTFNTPEEAEEYALKINEAARKMRNKLDDLEQEVASE